MCIRDRCNTIVALKLDRLTRSVFDWGKIIRSLEENDAYLDCANEDINTTNQTNSNLRDTNSIDGILKKYKQEMKEYQI